MPWISCRIPIVTMASGFLLRWKAIAGAVARNSRCVKTFADRQRLGEFLKAKQCNEFTYNWPTTNGRVHKLRQVAGANSLRRFATQALLVLAVASSSLAATAPPAVLQNSKSSELPHGRKMQKVSVFYSFLTCNEFGAATTILRSFMNSSHCHDYIKTSICSNPVFISELGEIQTSNVQESAREIARERGSSRQILRLN